MSDFRTLDAQEEQANNQTQTQGITPRERANKLIASPTHKAMPSRQALDPGQQVRGCELEGKAAGLIRGDGDHGDETRATLAFHSGSVTVCAMSDQMSVCLYVASRRQHHSKQTVAVGGRRQWDPIAHPVFELETSCSQQD